MTMTDTSRVRGTMYPIIAFGLVLRATAVTGTQESGSDNRPDLSGTITTVKVQPKSDGFTLIVTQEICNTAGAPMRPWPHHQCPI